jgi:hypothetical protein
MPGGCARVPLGMNHNARQSHVDRRRDCRTVGAVRLVAKKRVFEADAISRPPRGTAILPSVKVAILCSAFDLGSVDSDVLQCSIV